MLLVLKVVTNELTLGETFAPLIVAGWAFVAYLIYRGFEILFTKKKKEE